MKEKDLDKLLSSNEKKTFIEIMNNIYNNIRTMCYSSVEEQIRREEEARRKKVEDKLNKKIESLKKEILSLKQSVIAENIDKSIDNSQFKKELVQLSLLYKDDRNVEENTDIFDNVQYHNSFISEIYLNSRERIKEGLAKDGRIQTRAFEKMDKELDIANKGINLIMQRFENYDARIKKIEKNLKQSSDKSDNDLDDNNGYSEATILIILDRLKKVEIYMDSHKEFIDSIPIIQKYTYKNEQDIKDVRVKVDHPPVTSSNPIIIPDDNRSPKYSYNNNYNNNSNNGYSSNKRQKMNENDYINKNTYNSGPDDLVPINSDQRTLNANGMFNRARNNRNHNFSPNSPPSMPNQFSAPPPNSTVAMLENRLNELDRRLNFNSQTINTLGDQIYEKHLQAIVEKFNEICAQVNTMNLKNGKNLMDDVEGRLKEFQDKVNNSNLNYINDHMKSYNKITIDSLDQSFKNINSQVNKWKRKMAEDLQDQFGRTIQELKLQILSLATLPIPKGSSEYMNLVDFLKEVFRWNWEKWKIEWTKEFYQCVQLLRKDYIKPLEDKINKLERAK